MLLAIILTLFVMTVLPLASSVVLGLLTALVCYPIQTYFRDHWKLHRSMSALVVTLLLIGFFVVPMVIVSLTVIKQGNVFVRAASTFSIQDSYNRILSLIPTQRENFEDSLKDILSSFAAKATELLTRVVSSIPQLGLDLVMFLLAFFYGLADGHRLMARISPALPFSDSERKTLYYTTERICRGVVSSSLASSLSQGLIMGIGYWALGVPQPLLFGTMTSIFSFVPVLGAGPAGIGGAIYLWANGHTSQAIAMLFVFGAASMADNVVKPLVLRGQAEMHPLLGLVSAIGGLLSFGFPGLFLGPLFAALMLVVLKLLSERNQSAAI